MAIIRNAIIVAVIVVAASSLYMLIYLNSAPNNKDKSVKYVHHCLIII